MNSFRLQCPGCGTYSERTDVSNLCVQCEVCTEREGRVFEFCWQWEREWKGRRPRADRCDNDRCTSSEQEILRDCPVISLKKVQNVQCPSFRACINCGVLIEHTGEGCKIMTCRICEREFCFICLKAAKNCLATKKHFEVCIDGVAPRQELVKISTDRCFLSWSTICLKEKYKWYSIILKGKMADKFVSTDFVKLSMLFLC